MNPAPIRHAVRSKRSGTFPELDALCGNHLGTKSGDLIYWKKRLGITGKLPSSLCPICREIIEDVELTRAELDFYRGLS